MKQTALLIASLIVVCSMTANAQKMILEDFNDDTLAPGFFDFYGEGNVIPNQTDNETWTIEGAYAAWGGWNNFESSAISSPEFKADEFTAVFRLRNFQRTSQSSWDCVAILIAGLEEDLIVYLGSSSNDGQLVPNYALYAEIQHPDKANGYIWDSQVSYNSQEVPSPWKDYVDVFPATVELEIVFRGPGQPMDVYYNFDGMGRTHLLQWDDAEPAHTFENVLAKDAGDTYYVTIHANTGSQPFLAFDIDEMKITGELDSEFAVDDPNYTFVQDWMLMQ